VVADGAHDVLARPQRSWRWAQQPAHGARRPVTASQCVIDFKGFG
jgi:hypothetical protein